MFCPGREGVEPDSRTVAPTSAYNPHYCPTTTTPSTNQPSPAHLQLGTLLPLLPAGPRSQQRQSAAPGESHHPASPGGNCVVVCVGECERGCGREKRGGLMCHRIIALQPSQHPQLQSPFSHNRNMPYNTTNKHTPSTQHNPTTFALKGQFAGLRAPRAAAALAAAARAPPLAREGRRPGVDDAAAVEAAAARRREQQFRCWQKLI